MSWILRSLASGVVILLLRFPADAQQPGADGAAEPKTQSAPLTREEIGSAARIDAVTIPTPGEVMVALEKEGKPDWAGEMRPPIATNLSSRAQLAINLGGLIADGYIAVEAEDAQQVKNIGKDIVTLAKPLGVGQDILNRGKSLTEFADRGQWDTLKEELEATQNEVKAAMIENKDQDLVILVSLGGWLRGTEVISNYIAAHYSEAAAKLLRQPAIVRYLSEQLKTLPEKVRDEPAVRRVQAKLPEIESAVSFPRDGAPSQSSVKTLNTITSDLLKELARKDLK